MTVPVQHPHEGVRDSWLKHYVGWESGCISDRRIIGIKLSLPDRTVFVKVTVYNFTFNHELKFALQGDTAGKAVCDFGGNTQVYLCQTPLKIRPIEVWRWWNTYWKILLVGVFANGELPRHMAINDCPLLGDESPESCRPCAPCC